MKVTLRKKILVSILSGLSVFVQAEESSNLKSGPIYDKAVAFCEKQPSFCFSRMLELRCLQLNKGLECILASHEIIKTLDLSQVEGWDLPRAFTDELHKASGNKALLKYLRRLPKEAKNRIQNNEPFSLWQYTLDQTENDFEKAIRWIAVALQDNTQNRYYLEGNDLNPVFKKRIESANSIIGLETLQNSENASASLIRVYPTPLIDDSELNPNFYHFYVSAALSNKLKAKGYSDDIAVTVPLIFNSLYEFASVEEQENWPLRDPKFLDPAKYDWKLRDLYQGYLGAHFGAGSKATLSFSEFVSTLNTKGIKAVK
jgi:hypothetical protein